jgi:hypothetical protein
MMQKLAVYSKYAVLVKRREGRQKFGGFYNIK